MKSFLVLFVLGLTLLPMAAAAQEQQAQQQQPTAEQLEKEKAERQKNAYRLLDQVIDEAQSLRLTENRVRVQINAGDLLWESNQGRAHSLFAMAADGIAELGRSTQNNNNRRGGPPAQDRRAFQLRQELVLAVARHDAPLAYQLLAATKPAQPVATTDQRGPRAFNLDDNLEQALLGRVAAFDPKFAAQNAEQMLDKGQFPRTTPDVIINLQKQDADAAAKLADKTVKKLQAANLSTNGEATSLALLLLAPGPRPAGSATSPSAKGSYGRVAVLDQSAYLDLLGSVLDLALKATPLQPPVSVTVQRARPGVGGGTGGGVGPRQNNTQVTQPTDAQMEQNTARRLLMTLQLNLPTIEQFAPAKANQIRQKAVEVGMSGPNSPLSMAQAMGALQGDPTADALLQAAATAPPQMQSRLYQQAAYKALEEGNTAQARQIATDHLQENARDSVMRQVAFKEMAQKGASTRIEDVRQTLARLQSDTEKIDLLLQMAATVQKDNEKFAIQLLEEAKQIANRRATSYDHFEQQLRVAHAFASLDPARSFEILDSGISQINELLNAASVLNGFEVSMFRDGEMLMQGGNGLVGMISRFGQELAQLANKDVDRADALAGRFQFAESRIMVRMTIVQGLLGVQPASGSQMSFRNFNIGGGDVYVRPN